MRYSFFFLLLFLLSCTENTTMPGMPQSYIKFMVNGKQFEYTGGCDSLTDNHAGVCTSNCSIISIDTPPHLACYAIAGGNPGGDELVYFQILADSPVTASYTPTSGLFEAYVSMHNIIHSSVFNHSQFTVNVTRNANGTIDGNFEGTLYWPIITSAGFDSVIITGGEFKNVEINH